ncbi:MAG: isoaspartyl peptidase/L-asparaginase [Bacteroidota bacterium]|nr:isoaspartyl peptidase/L-asparaginase [Bacteroidota bacterium]
MKKPYAIAIHGGAGTILKSEMTHDKEAAFQKAIKVAIDKAYKVLNQGGTAMDAVEVAVMELEDCLLFNAGKGSVFTANGTYEMDASIMDGSNLDAGAVSLLTNVKNPVQLARWVMERTEHVFMAGKGAEEFASENGMVSMPPEYFYNEFRFQQLQLAKQSDRVILDHDGLKEYKFGTVGAVALDQNGNLAAATSTGGMTNKKYGRIGDSPMIGCGTYANNESCAISCTGSGEFFIRVNAAFHVHALMKYANLNLMNAADKLIHDILASIGGDGGLIAIDTQANVWMPFNTEGMYRGYKKSSGEEEVLIYR